MKAKQELERKHPRIFHGPKRHFHNTAERYWQGYHTVYYAERGSAAELWARASTLQPHDEIMDQVKPVIHRDALWVEFMGEKFFLGSNAGVGDVRRLLTELREKQCEI